MVFYLKKKKINPNVVSKAKNDLSLGFVGQYAGDEQIETPQKKNQVFLGISFW